MLTYITESLDLALRHVSSQIEGAEPSLIWADALCINQENDTEKSWQVQLMRKIYASAVKVLAWLGVASHDSDLAIKFLSSLGSSILTAMKTFGHDWPLHVTIPLQKPNGSVHDLIRRAWFTRLWVFQEVAVAKQILLVCGRSVLNGDQFMASLEAFGQDKEQSTKPLFWNSPENIQMGQSWECLEKVESELMLGPATGIFGTRKLLLSGVRHNLAGLLHTRNLIGMQATDRRDYIHALLGIATDAEQLGLYPDYSKTWQDVFRDTTVAFLRRNNQNDLTMILSRCFENKVPGLPSWVPDWTTHHQQTLPLIGSLNLPYRDMSGEISAYPRIFTTSGHRKQELNFQGVVQCVLGVKGAYFDVVENVGPTVEQCGGNESWEKYLVAWFNALFNLLDYKVGQYEECAEMVVCRTALTDMLFDQSIHGAQRIDPLSYQTYAEFFKNFWETVQKGECDVIGFMEFAIQIAARARNRRAFCTSRGFLGLGYQSMQPGDVILVVLGVEFPMIFRGCGNGRLRVVGDAYVHGIMNGEFMGRGIEIETFQVERQFNCETNPVHWFRLDQRGSHRGEGVETWYRSFSCGLPEYSILVSLESFITQPPHIVDRGSQK